MLTADGTGVSNDGRIVAGFQVDNSNPGSPEGVVRHHASRWVDGGEPQILSDTYGQVLGWVWACSARCDVIVGGAQGGEIIDPGHPNLGQAWFWTADTGGIYLGAAPDGLPGVVYHAYGVTADGSMIIGFYVGADDGGPVERRGFVWTQATGMVSIRQLLSEQGLSDDDWSIQQPVSITSTGARILLEGTRRNHEARAAVMYLSPRIDDLDMLP